MKKIGMRYFPDFIILIILFYCIKSFACMSGYESVESLSRRARLILEVEVVSVQDSPKEKEKYKNLQLYSLRKYKNVHAKVKVLEVVKGKCELKAFDLIGGPYLTCSPFQYLTFKKGERFFLILDHYIPDKTKAVLITWRPRAMKGNKKKVLSLIQNARDAWNRELDWHRKAAPKAFAQAESLLKGTKSKLGKDILAKQSYAVLACLRLLLMDPDKIPPGKPELSNLERIMSSDDPDSEEDGKENKVSNVYFTSKWGAYPLPKELISAMKKRSKTDLKEILSFNKKLFEVFCKDHLSLPDDKIQTFLKNWEYAEDSKEIAYSPYYFKFDNTDKDLNTLSLLIALSADEPDYLAYRTFGMSLKSGTLNEKMIVDYVSRHPERDYNGYYRQKVLLSIPHPKIAPVIGKNLEKVEDYYHLDRYFQFYPSFEGLQGGSASS